MRGVCFAYDFSPKIIMPVERIEIFTNFVSANDEKHQPK